MIGENADELWDLYTKDREKTGCLHRRGDPMPHGKYRLAVHVCIFNSRNELLIQQRQPYKKGWPNMWDVSVGGCAGAGENSCQAAQREVKEELGLEVDLSDARPFFSMSFSGGFDDFYIVQLDVDLSMLRLQEEEVKSIRWADQEEILKMQAQGIMIPYWFLDRLFTIRDNYDFQGEWLHKIQVQKAEEKHLETWMSLVEIVRGKYPQLSREPALVCYRDGVVDYMKRNKAVCALDGCMAVGFLLAGAPKDMPCSRAVHPEYNEREIAGQMERFAAGQLSKDIG